MKPLVRDALPGLALVARSVGSIGADRDQDGFSKESNPAATQER